MSRWNRLAKITGVTGRAVTRRAAVAVTHALKNRQQRRDAIAAWQSETADDVTQTLSRMKGAAMKVGQQMAVAAASLDLPSEVRDKLSLLHDSAEPVPYDQIQATLQEELGEALTSHVEWIDPSPLGAWQPPEVFKYPR